MVAECAELVRLADVDGDERLQRLRRAAAFQGERAERAGDDGECDVVEGARTGAAQVVQRLAVTEEHPPGAGVLVELRFRSPGEEVLGQGSEDPPGVTNDGAGARSRPQGGAGDLADQPGGDLGAVEQRVDRAHDDSRRRRRSPCRQTGWGDLVLVAVQAERGDQQGGPAVGHRVVDAPDDADATVVQARGEGDLPERVGAIEWRREQLIPELPETLEAQRLPEVHDVGVDIERLVVDPARLAESERMELHTLAAARDVAQPAGHAGAQGLDRRPPDAGGQRSERAPADVHVGSR